MRDLMRGLTGRRSISMPLFALTIFCGSQTPIVAQARQAGTTMAAPRGLELQDYYRVETASAPAISPDGKRVAFVRTYLIENENRRQSEIWLAPSDGSSSAVRISNPAFSA